MKFLEPILLSCWLIGILMIQFHKRTNSSIKKWDYLGLFPSFHLFSPRPFRGIYLIRYKIIEQKTNSTIEDQLNYIGRSDLLDANQKIVKCINNLCKSSVTRPTISNVNFTLLLNFIKKDARKKSYTGKIQFFILIDSGSEVNNLKFSSRIYDL